MKEKLSKSAQDFQVGESMTGTVESISKSSRRQRAAFLDVGLDRAAYLDYQEVADSSLDKAFNALKLGDQLDCRVPWVLALFFTRNEELGLPKAPV